MPQIETAMEEKANIKAVIDAPPVLGGEIKSIRDDTGKIKEFFRG